MTERQELLLLVVGGQEWTLPAQLVRQVLSPRPVTRVPGADSSLVGLVAWRGRVVCVVSVNMLNGGCCAGGLCTDGRLLLVIESGKDLVALLVDEVRGFVLNHGPDSEHRLLDLERLLGEQ